MRSVGPPCHAQPYTLPHTTPCDVTTLNPAPQILRWMQKAGMSAYIDAIGNVHGVVEGSNPELGELLVGSHYDTVVDGGK